MAYPNIIQYKEAIQDPESFAQLSGNIKPVMNGHDPVFASGNFASVFKMKRYGEFYALKCFLKDLPKRKYTQTRVVKYLNDNPSKHFVKYHFIEKEIWVNDNEYPITWMEWIEAPTLGEKIKLYVNTKNKIGLKILADNFKEFALWILDQPFAHGDLKHDNIIIKDNNDLILVDYDGMFVPSLEGQITNELGGKSYQHPKRTSKTFDRNLDDFSLLIIYSSLIALSKDPSLFDKYNNDQNMIFNHTDFLDVKNSKLFNELTKYDDLKPIISVIINSLNSDGITIPDIDKTITEVDKYNHFFEWEKTLDSKDLRLKNQKIKTIEKEAELNLLEINLATLSNSLEEKDKVVSKMDNFLKTRTSKLILLENGLKEKEFKINTDLIVLENREVEVSNAIVELEMISKDVWEENRILKLKKDEIDKRSNFIKEENILLDKKRNDLDNDKLYKLKIELKKLEESLKIKEQKAIDFEINLNSKSYDINDKEKQLTIKLKKNSAIESKIENSKNNIKTQLIDIEKKTIELSEKEKEINKLKVDLEETKLFKVKKNLDNKQNEISKTNLKLNEQIENYNKLQFSQERKNRQLDNLEIYLNKEQARLELLGKNLKKSYKNKESQLTSLEDTLNNRKTQLEVLEKKLQVSEKEINFVSKSLARFYIAKDRMKFEFSNSWLNKLLIKIHFYNNKKAFLIILLIGVIGTPLYHYSIGFGKQPIGNFKFKTTFRDDLPIKFPLRYASSANSEILYRCQNNEMVYVIDDSDKNYFKVNVNGQEGFLFKEYLKPIKVLNTKYSIEKKTTQNPEKVTLDIEIKSNDYKGIYKYKTTFNKPAFEPPLRSKPSIESSEIYKCPKDAAVYVIENDNPIFAKVFINGYKGYLSKGFLKKIEL
jgi:hypothetical protein